MEISAIEINNIKDVILDESGFSSAFFSLNENIAINSKVIDELKKRAYESKIDIRLCLHRNSQSDFHDMIIVQQRQNYYPPHKHLKPESYHLIDGELGAIHYDELGNITKICKLSLENNFIYRIAANEYHVVFPLSEVAVYHESKPGPFIRVKDFVEPKWSPNMKNNEEIKKFNIINRSLF